MPNISHRLVYTQEDLVSRADLATVVTSWKNQENLDPAFLIWGLSRTLYGQPQLLPSKSKEQLQPSGQSKQAPDAVNHPINQHQQRGASVLRKYLQDIKRRYKRGHASVVA